MFLKLWFIACTTCRIMDAGFLAGESPQAAIPRMESVMRPENTLPRTVFGLVTDRPFSADVELRMDHRYFRGFMARDRYGRQRSEMIFAPGVSSVTVEDPVRHRQYVLLMNFGSRQVIEQDIPG